MNQPELGKKIAELRKSKGLTQEELVEKCNLNVRTLQRIETGGVTPRIYTLKVIFGALEYNSNDLFEITNSGYSMPYWIEQFYRYVLDLFNLKTNTMRKITILSILLSAIILGIFAINANVRAQKSDNAQITERKEIESTLEREFMFSNFTCYGCLEKDGLMIGRDVSFTLNGVKVKNLRLIALNKKTREFNSLFVTGKFLERKVEVDYPHDMLIDGGMEYSADKIEKSDSKIYLKGNAKVMDINNKNDINDDESIEADEILISLK